MHTGLHFFVARICLNLYGRYFVSGSQIDIVPVNEFLIFVSIHGHIFKLLKDLVIL